MPIVGARHPSKADRVDCLDTDAGVLRRGWIGPGRSAHLARWPVRHLANRGEAHLAFEGCTGWRYVGEGAGQGRGGSAPGRAGRHGGRNGTPRPTGPTPSTCDSG